MLLTAQTASAHKQMLSALESHNQFSDRAVFTTSVIGNVVETDRCALAIRGGKETFQAEFRAIMGFSRKYMKSRGCQSSLPSRPLNPAQAVVNLKALCRTDLANRCEIEVVDVSREPKRALADGIFMTPTLIKLAPSPNRRIVGTLSQTQPVLQALGLETLAA
jgi:circadian clock protein KaiB